MRRRIPFILQSASDGGLARPVPLIRSPWKFVIGTVCAVILSVLAYVGVVLATDNFHAVYQGELYRSGQLDEANLLASIESFDIRSVLNLRGRNDNERWYQKEIRVCSEHGVEHYDLPLLSSKDVSIDEMDRLIAIAASAPKPLLIHCAHGADRTGLAVCLYEYSLKQQSAATAFGNLTLQYGYAPLFRPSVFAMSRSFWRFVEAHPHH